MTSSISEKIKSIERQIPAEVRLVAISKKVSVESMIAAYKVGIRDFGESRLQEALAKKQELQDLSDIRWHFIGHIQKNKAKKIIENFTWIHSVDSLDIALRLDKLAGEMALKPQVFLQVKPLPDPNKYGWEIHELRQDLDSLDRCKNLKIQGLMTILPWGLSESEAANGFKTTQQFAAEIAGQNWSNLSMKELSMGMSGDYLSAIEAGATMIRVGRTIFGERKA